MMTYVPSRGYVPRMHLLRWYRYPITVVVNDRSAEKDVKKHFSHARVIVANASRLVDARNFLAQEVIKKNEWYIGMDDDIEQLQITAPSIWHSDSGQVDMSKDPPNRYETWRQAYRIKLKNVEGFFRVLQSRIEKEETICGGVATLENPFFRQRKWSVTRFVKSYVHVMKNTREIPWHGKFGHDSCMTTQVLMRYGAVAVCNYVYGVQKAYGKGGLGSSKERRPILNRHLSSIVKHAEGLVGIGRGANTALRILRTSRKSIQNWIDENPDWKRAQLKHLKEDYE